ncbi:putative leucine-rich repeat-containing protein DDB_G0290503 isoform X3 [Hemibagrus wyckioides]|uniref:putative leucine-rich repeat-containing protein DDB_G0290503 isoform X3 n=1 Tax=Hemibagrus wyckioides TaxID=337641 RepID=UPI00266C322B|nr:putative leucine-rich repeat-containing protein DDB_G0290503 isoform X3 [Hemibagrus wyckioides]
MPSKYTSQLQAPPTPCLPASQPKVLHFQGKRKAKQAPAMQFCSLHHCVLVFLILTFTTAPVSALDVCPTRVKLHQSVTLSCKHQCSGLLQWALYNNRDVVQARCDQTSCWSEKGFNISHDQYLKGDLSLTITAADYSQRNVYACECEDSDFSYVRLIIETVFSQVQMKFGEDLKLHVSVPEPVEVIYKSSGSADEVICRVNNLSLQCKDKYRDRTSLTYPELTLRHMEPRDSGRYTIRDTKNEEDIQIYAVSVEDKPGFPVWGIVLIVLSLLCCAGLGIYLLLRYLLREQAILKRRLGQVDQLVQQAVGGTEENIDEAEMSVDQLKQQYINTEYSDKVKLFCNEKRKQLQQHRERLRREELERRQQHVEQLVQQAEEGTKENIREAKESLDQLKQQYENTEYSDKVSVFCRAKRKQLMNRRLLQVEQLVQQAEEGKEENIREVEQQIERLEQQYSKYLVRVSSFCSARRKHLNWYRVQHSNDEHLMTEREELNKRLLYVNQLVQQAEGGTQQNIREAEKELDQLEQQYKNKDYSEQIKFLCRVKRIELKQYSGQPSNEQHLMCGDGELQRQQERVEQFVQQAKDGKIETIREAKVEIDHLEQMQYLNTKNVVPVTPFSMLKRAELYWYRLLNSDEEQIMTEKIEMKKKLEKVMDGLQKLRGGAERKQKIPTSTEVDEVQKHLIEFKKWCEKTEGQINDLIEHRGGAV